MKKNSFILLSALFSVFWGGNIISNNDFVVHTGRFKNDSSHNIYIQQYSKDHYNLESGNFLINGTNITRHTIEYGAPLYDYFPNLEKILIIDTDNNKLLKKITGATYYDLLTSPEIVVEKNADGGKTTYYIYYFVITDEFLNDN